jgi:hypothetical protein
MRLVSTAKQEIDRFNYEDRYKNLTHNKNSFAAHIYSARLVLFTCSMLA